LESVASTAVGVNLDGLDGGMGFSQGAGEGDVFGGEDDGEDGVDAGGDGDRFRVGGSGGRIRKNNSANYESDDKNQ
jgi:hypothetical protein